MPTLLLQALAHPKAVIPFIQRALPSAWVSAELADPPCAEGVSWAADWHRGFSGSPNFQSSSQILLRPTIPSPRASLDFPHFHGGFSVLVLWTSSSVTWTSFRNYLEWNFLFSNDSTWQEGKPGLKFRRHATFFFFKHQRIAIRASLIALLVKNLSPMQETLVWSLGWEDLLEKGLATHSSILGLPLWLSW